MGLFTSMARPRCRYEEAHAADGGSGTHRALVDSRRARWPGACAPAPVRSGSRFDGAPVTLAPALIAQDLVRLFDHGDDFLHDVREVRGTRRQNVARLELAAQRREGAPDVVPRRVARNA